MQSELLSIFKNVADPRSYRNQRHPFISIIGISLLGVLSGIDGFSGLADYAEMHLEELQKYLDLPNGAPSHDTFQRVWSTISPTEFLESFHEFTQTIASVFKGGIISIDGKKIRNSGDNPLTIVSAWCAQNELVLAQEKVSDKSNEITAVPKLLRLLDLNSKIVTMDAMGCQREACEQIVEKEGDYLIALKGNQGSLHKDVKEWFQDEKLRSACDTWEEHDKGHRRIESRKAFVTDDIGWLQHHQWPHLRSIGMVEAQVTKSKKVTTETRFYISSLPAKAEEICKAARAHWGIENKLHWRLDVVFNEDKACITNDNAAENMDILRKWALNILRKAKEKPDQSIKSVQRKASMSFKYLVSLINKIFHA